jgi:Putative addiction module component
MSTSADAILDSALKLPNEERAWIAAALIASLDGRPEAGAEAAWDAEVDRRVEQADHGDVELLDWVTVKADVAQILKRR